MTVVVPAGGTIGTYVVCLGRGSVQVMTEPDSQAEQTITCDGNAVPSQLGAFAENPLRTVMSFRITVKALGASRWLVAAAGTVPP